MATVQIPIVETPAEPRTSWQGAYRPRGTRYANCGTAVSLMGRRSDEWKYWLIGEDRAVMVVRFDLPNGTKKYQVITQYRGSWYVDWPEVPFYLYNLNTIKDRRCTTETIYVCEGEKAAEAAKAIRLCGTTSLGGPTRSAYTCWFPTAERNVVILPDFDDVGQKYAEEVAQLCLAAGAKSVKIVNLPGLPEGGDIVDWIGDRDWKADESKAAMRAEIEALVAVAPDVERKEISMSQEAVAVDKPIEGQPIVRLLSEVEPEYADWLIDGVVARGKLTLLAGEPGVGTSLLAMEIVARVTRGHHRFDDASVDVPTDMQDEVPEDTPSGVLMFSAERELADTTRVQVDAVNALADSIHAFVGMQTEDDTGNVGARSFSLNSDLPILESELDRLEREGAGIKLVVIDPIDVYLDANGLESEASQLASQLAELAARKGVAILVVSSLFRAATVMSKLRGVGTKRSAITGALADLSRLIWIVVPDLDSTERRLLLPVKSNLSGEWAGWEFSIVNSAVQWSERVVDLSADEYFAQRSVQRRPVVLKEGTELFRAVEFLKEELANGAIHSTTIKETAEGNGISWSTIRRGFHYLRGRATKEKGTNRWVWNLVGQCLELATSTT